MSKTYTPQPGSVPWMVIEFLTTNPGEELTRDDVAAKYDKPEKNVHSLLGLAVDSGMLKRGQNDDGEVTYTLGSGCPAIKPSKARNPTLRPDALLAGAELGSKANRSPPPEIDLAAVVLREDVPLPTGRGAASATNWGDLLARMKVGNSCVLPKRARPPITKVAKEWKDAGKGEFALRRISEAEFGLWRVK